MPSVSVPDHALPIDASFDVVLADQLARYETYNKHHYRPHTYLHKWWGRRCGSTFRMILKGLVETQDQQDYYSPRGLEGKVILDPMMGGGTTLHEAIRLGANVIGIDLDPIPVLQARATLTDVALPQMRSAFNRLFSSLQDSLGSFFLTHCPYCAQETPYWYGLHGLRQRCDCRDVLIVDSLVLRYQSDETVIRLCPSCGDLLSSGEHVCSGELEPLLIEKSQLVCHACQGKFQDRQDLPYHERYELLVLAGHCAQHGFFLKSPDPFDRELQLKTNELRGRINLPRAEFIVQAGDKSHHLLRRGINNYLDLFSSRQLLFMEHALASLPDDDPAIRLNLALLLSTSLEFNSLLCGYKGVNVRRAGAVRHAFSHHGYSFPYTALETNPIYPRRASGTLQKLFYSRVERGLRWAVAPRERSVGPKHADFIVIQDERDFGQEVLTSDEIVSGTQRFFLQQDSAVNLPVRDNSVDAVVTDPPYFDSIQYGDLSAFFRVWLKQMLPTEANWTYSPELAAVNSEQHEEADQFARLMILIFQECRRVLRPDRGRLIFTFHHWRPRAWSALANALYQAEFRLLNRYVVHAEHPISVHIHKMRALTHDAILIFAPAQYAPVTSWPRPTPMRKMENQVRDSFGFTQGCANFLGWVLEQKNLDGEAIESLWVEYLREN